MQKEVGRQTGRRRKRNVFLPWINKNSLHRALAKWSPFGSPSPRPCYTGLFGLTALITSRKKCASKRSQPRALLVFPTTSPVFFTMFISLCHPPMGWFLSTTTHLAQGTPMSSDHHAGKNEVTTASAVIYSIDFGWAVGQTFCQLTSQGQLLATQIHNGFTFEEIWGFGSPKFKKTKEML